MTTATEKRARALEAYEAAQQNGADWRAIAAMLADVIPKPKAAAQAGPEWCEYTPAQHQGRGKTFRANVSALFEFADGVVIGAPLRHRCSKPAPDWSRAARFAVRFYRLGLARELMGVTGGRWGNVCQGAEEIYATKCKVPAIIDALDESRDVRPDLERINTSTAALREGREFMSDMDGPDLKEAALTALYGPRWAAVNGRRVPQIERDDVPEFIPDGQVENYRQNVAAFAAE